MGEVQSFVAVGKGVGPGVQAPPAPITFCGGAAKPVQRPMLVQGAECGISWDKNAQEQQNQSFLCKDLSETPPESKNAQVAK